MLEKIIGECGTQVTFRVVHQGAKSPVDITLPRGTPIYWYCTRMSPQSAFPAPTPGILPSLSAENEWSRKA